MSYKVCPVDSCKELYDLVLEELTKRNSNIVLAWEIIAAQHDAGKEPSNARPSKPKTVRGYKQFDVTRHSVRFRYYDDTDEKVLWIKWIDPPEFWFD